MQTSLICSIPALFLHSFLLPVPVRVPVCARVSRVCPVCVPAPPGVFLPVLYCVDGKSESHCLYSTVSTVLFKSSQVRSIHKQQTTSFCARP